MEPELRRHLMSKASVDVLAERERQIKAEGYDTKHDDEHNHRELSAAAACYADAFGPDDQCPACWPWGTEAWNPKDYRSNMVRAAALLLAEIERLDRAAG